MATLLHLETATQVCSVALSSAGKLVGLRESNDKNSHSVTLTVFIDELMREAGIRYQELDAVVVSMGPGSYTGLRIGVSTAKGICFATDKPLISIGTLLASAAGVKRGFPTLGLETLLCPMIDARRMEVYYALYNSDLSVFREVRAEVITGQSFDDLLQSRPVWFFGDGAEKCRPLLESLPNAYFPDNISLSASHMIELAEEKFSRKEFENVVYFEPYYLKDFIPGIPKVKGLK